MEKNLLILLEKIEINKDYYSYFNDGILKRVISNKNKDMYNFEISLKNMLPVFLYEELTKLLTETFSNFKKIKTTFIIDEKDYDLLTEYFIYFLDMYSKESYVLKMIEENYKKSEDNTMFFEVANKNEQKKINSIEDKLLKDLKLVGFDNLKLDIKINNEASLKIIDDIKKDMEIEIPINIVKKEEPKKNNRKTSTDETVITGRNINTEVMTLNNVLGPMNNITIEGTLFGDIDIRNTKTDLKILTLKITDFTDSIRGKLFINDEDELNKIVKGLKSGKWFKFRGHSKDDQYSKELVFSVYDINHSNKIVWEKSDNSEEKRVELHTHTKMSQMDGVADEVALVKQAIKWGHKAIAITDHNGCQSFPHVYNTVRDYNKGKEQKDKFKAIYGTEIVLIDDNINIVIRENDSLLLDNTYVVFDFETTGFNAGGGDSVIEIGAVKILNGEIIDTFNELINPMCPLSYKITQITSITDDMLVNKDSEENAMKRFISWFGDNMMVAHNAKFDVSFLEMAYKKYNLGTFKNTVIDTLELSRTMDNNFARHSLTALVKRYEVEWDENAHHRADYDAKGTAFVFHKMMLKLINMNKDKVSDLNKLVPQNEIHKYGRSFHANILALNKIGLKNLFKIISLANTTYLHKTPRILRSEIIKLREGLLIGSGCYEGEVYIEAKSKGAEELTNIINFYDYVEVQPLDCYSHLIGNDFATNIELTNHIKKIINATLECGKIMIATGDVHQIKDDDKIYRQIIANQKVPGGGRHPLARYDVKNIPSQYFRTTEEMLNSFEFLGDELSRKLVIENTNKIADMIEEIEVIIETGGIPFSPKIENSVETVKELVYGKAHEMYGELLPDLISVRIEQELTGIIKGGFDVIYLIAQKLVKKSNDDGYLVGSRGSVGSSFVATLMGITEVNPLPAHYLCRKCKTSLFEIDEKTLGSDYSSGYDLPDLNCPNCKELLGKEGQDMPFATFLGFDADKVPDIDLNFSGDYQWKAHEYTKELFGIDNVYKAGTIGTVAEKTAFGFVKGYCEDNGFILKTVEIERLAEGCTGVKRTTGQHPGGIIVVPGYMDVFDFTPFQYPADDNNSLWRTSHFDYHAIDQDLLKLDILGHDDPTVLRMLQDLSGIDVTKIPMDDKKVLSLLTSPKALGVNKDEIMCPTGTLGLPELGTRFVINMLVETEPDTFSGLVKISGLSHGTDVWSGNASELVKNKVVPFKDVIGCRDDIMVYLMYNGVAPKDAFKIMEFVRKGRPSKDPEGWKIFEEKMKEAKIPEWYIESCHKIKYMFPKAHAVAYVMSALRIAWFKVHHPILYYAAFFSIRCNDFDIEAMVRGYASIKNKIIEITNKGYEATNKESSILDVLNNALEASARKIKFANIDINASDASKFIVIDENTILPPFRTIDGLGDVVAKKIVEEREKGPFLSIEDLQKRGKVSGTLIEKMRLMGVLDGMDESSQLSLF